MILTLFLSLCLVSGTDININDSINLKGNTNPTQIITVYNNRDIKTNNNDVELKTQTIDADNQKDKNTSNPILNSNNQKRTNNTGKNHENETSKLSKENLKIAKNTNFLKNGDKLHLYLKNSKGKAIANKILYLTFNGKTYNKVSSNKGEIIIKIISKKPVNTLIVNFKGDNKYNKFKEKINLYISQLISLKLEIENYLQMVFSESI